LRSIERIAGLAALAGILAGCGGQAWLKLKDGEAAGELPGLAQAVVLEDFEDQSAAPETTANAEYGARVQGQVQSEVRASGRQALRVDYDSGNGSWGGTAYCRRVGAPAAAAGARMVEFRAWAPAGAVFSLALHEDTRNGGDGEVWISPDLAGQGRWELYGVPIQRFYRSGYSGSQAGAGVLDSGALVGVELMVAARQGSGRIFLDEVTLK
jgi:hypothetical protein